MKSWWIIKIDFLAHLNIFTGMEITLRDVLYFGNSLSDFMKLYYIELVLNFYHNEWKLFVSFINKIENIMRIFLSLND